MKIRTHCDMIRFSCAYARTGDVLKVSNTFWVSVPNILRGEKPTRDQFMESRISERQFLWLLVSFVYQTLRPSFYHSSSIVKQTKNCGRDNDLHRLLFMPNGLLDGAELARYSKGHLRILGGYKQGNGIVCSCCHTEISPLKLEAHARWSARRPPAGGDLIICDGCPRAFHADAIPFEYVIISSHIDIRAYY
ncbi:hypothetical protein ACSBR2_000601 [Camellia fascicularis]